jgi:hypothetical protein
MSIKVAMSDQEQKSGDREPLPGGNYHCAITQVELSSPAQGENMGRPMLVFSFTVQESNLTKVANAKPNQFAGRVMMTNACVWEGAMYTIVGIYKAIGEYANFVDDAGNLDVQTEEEFYLGRQLMVRRALDKKQKEQWPDMEERWIQVRGFSKIPDLAVSGSSSGSSPADAGLLP